jgi:pimeloyl-ACP methyl ester carboxylesterase
VTLRRRGPAGLIAIFATSVGVVLLSPVSEAGLRSSARAADGSPRQGPFAGQINIGHGRKLYLRCAGRGSPTVMLESGIHDSSDPWSLTDTKPPVVPTPSVFDGVARLTHVCMYDRPGTIRYTNPLALTARSTPVPMPRRLAGMAADEHALLAAADIRGRVVLVAHSFGGLIDRLFAQTYRSRVAGMVLVDTFGTDIRRLFGPRLWPPYVRLLNHPGTALDNQSGFETIDVEGAISAVRHAKPLPRMPLAVITKTEPFGTAPGTPKDITRKLEQVWPETQRALVRLEPQTPLVYATGSDHYVQLHDPDLTTEIVRLILDRVRHSAR